MLKEQTKERKIEDKNKNNTLLICIGKTLETQLLNLICENADANFFCDETPIGQTGLSTKFLIEASGKIQQQRFFWLASNYKTPNVERLTGN
jgi:hypothetical protein